MTDEDHPPEILLAIHEYRNKFTDHAKAFAAEVAARQEVYRAGEIVAALVVAAAKDQIGAVIRIGNADVKIVDIKAHYYDRSKACPVIVHKRMDREWGKRKEHYTAIGWDHINKRWRKLIQLPDNRTLRFEEDGK